MKRDSKIVQAFQDGKSRRQVARSFGVPIALVDWVLRVSVQPGGGKR
jgi:hypothetical protein